MDAGEADFAEVLDDEVELREEVRKVTSIEVDPVVVEDVERRLAGRQDEIAAFFAMPLAGHEGAGFLRYENGGFYRAHRDRAEVPSWPDAARRAIVVVVFLNGSRDAGPDGEFEGGVLRLFDGDRVIDVVPRAGALVAFPADLLHEVSAVAGGPRDTIVDWFYGAGA